MSYYNKRHCHYCNSIGMVYVIFLCICIDGQDDGQPNDDQFTTGVVRCFLEYKKKKKTPLIYSNLRVHIIHFSISADLDRNTTMIFAKSVHLLSRILNVNFVIKFSYRIQRRI